jgi:hypothetical protein
MANVKASPRKRRSRVGGTIKAVGGCAETSSRHNELPPGKGCNYSAPESESRSTRAGRPFGDRACHRRTETAQSSEFPVWRCPLSYRSCHRENDKEYCGAISGSSEGLRDECNTPGSPWFGNSQLTRPAAASTPGVGTILVRRTAPIVSAAPPGVPQSCRGPLRDRAWRPCRRRGPRRSR